jgi:phosphatidylglycerophosphatase A
VTDEVVGFLAVVLLFRLPSPWLTVLWAFPLIRAIDIIKVPPARRLEHLPGGWGVIADDLLAAVYTAALLVTLQWFQPTWFEMVSSGADLVRHVGDGNRMRQPL